jgi:hypothetical protein
MWIMIRKLLLFFILSVLITFEAFSQCAAVATDACTTNAPTVTGNSIFCNPPLNNAGRNNFRVTNMIANATYRVSNCGAGVDTQMTIRNIGGAVVGYNDDGGPACIGTAASIDFIPPATGDYRIQVNEFNCATTPSFNETGDITVTLIADPPPPLSNDDCSSAIPLTINASCIFSTYTNSGATDSGIANPVCASYSGGDVWFSVVVNGSGEVTIDTDTGVMTDSGMAIYSGNCGALNLIECDDYDSVNGLMSMITLTGRTPGETLYIRVWEFGNNNNGTFDICATGPVPPTVTDVSICPGDPSQDLTASASCTGSSSTSMINGNLDIAGPYADTPPWFIVSTDPCAFDPTYNKNYDTFDFQVDTDGVYVFEIDPALPPDFMGYIVLNDPMDPFTYGSCATGTWIAGDDDSGPGLDAAITANLMAGVDYTLVTTLAFSSSQSTPYTWNISGAGLLIGGTVDTIQWYTSATGGTPIGTGSNFDPVGVAGSGLVNTNTSGVYSFWAACSSTPTLRAQVDFVIGKIWNGTAGNIDWATATNWIPNGIPDATNCIIIANTGGYDPIINNTTDALGYNLTVEANAMLTIDDDDTDANYGSLTITDFIDLQGDSVLHVQNNSSLIQVNEGAPNINNNSGTGILIMDREPFISGTDYVYWSSPVSDMSLSNIYGIDTPNATYRWDSTIPNGTISVPPGPCTNANIPICFGDWEPYSGNMATGKGYISNGPISQGPVASNYPMSIAGTIINNGLITHLIESGNNGPAYCSFTYQPNGNDFVLVTPFDDNWNLIGNPYPSAISANAFINYSNGGVDNTLIEGAIHLWTHGTDVNNTNPDPFYDDYTLNYDPNDYLTYNLSGTNTYPNEITSTDYSIGSGQGFFVLALNDNETGSVTFSNTMRNIANDNSIFHRSSNTNTETENTIERHRIWLNLSNQNEQTSSTMVGYIEGATQAKDRSYDAYTFESNTMSIYSMIGEEKMVIQGRQLPFEIEDQVPLGVDILQEGNYTISISGVDGLFKNNNSQNIYLEDTYQGIIRDLKASPFSFNSESGTFYDRFILRFTNTALSIDDFEILNSIQVFEESNKIVVKSDYETIESIEVYDILGRTLFANKLVNSNRFYINSIEPSEMTLFLKIRLVDGKQKIAKIIF